MNESNNNNNNKTAKFDDADEPNNENRKINENIREVKEIVIDVPRDISFLNANMQKRFINSGQKSVLKHKNISRSTSHFNDAVKLDDDQSLGYVPVKTKYVNAHKRSRNKDRYKKHNKMQKHWSQSKPDRRIRYKTELDYLFDVVNAEAQNLELMSPPSGCLFSASYESQEPFDVISDNNDLNFDNVRIQMQNDTQNGTKMMRKKPRGRPLSISPELASSEYNENGVKVDMTSGGIDFDDSLFTVLDTENKKVYQCPEKSCDKTFPSLSRAKRHYIVHTGHRPFKCSNPTCQKYFSRKDNMLQHERMHCSASKRYQ